ncbi:MAG: hypothetical protein FH756_17815 [Firmicutes bacterium]|nr:hypothetical protein [Bacillota bacterium]
MNIEIHLEEETFVINKSKSLIGEIYFIVKGSDYFPEKGWFDFPAVKLSWWAENVIKINNSSVGTEFKLRFMDGPLYVKGVKKEEDIVELKFIKEQLNSENILLAANVSLNTLEKAIRTAAEKVVIFENKNKLESPDTEILKNQLKVL